MLPPASPPCSYQSATGTIWRSGWFPTTWSTKLSLALGLRGGGEGSAQRGWGGPWGCKEVLGRCTTHSLGSRGSLKRGAWYPGRKSPL